jgi:2-polyprenyl-3-methyl-5-hydroxy-6-metoxy-1,4-benzoquinol methylase
MLKRLKEKLYFLKQWYQIVFLYPKKEIDSSASLDYDAYWEQKRGNREGASPRSVTINERMRADIVAQTIGDGPVSIADIASGPGVIYGYLKEKLTLTEYIGYEYSAYALEVARSFGMHGIRFDINSAHDLDSIQEVDYILLLEILEHIPHSEKVLSHAVEKARRGVFFSFPNSGNFLYRLRLLLGRMPAQWVNFPNEHLRFWTLTDLTWWLHAQGYHTYTIHAYRGVPYLEKLWPALFAGSFVVYLPKISTNHS